MVMRTGTGGWSFPAWRGLFYPKGLAARKELEWASRRHGAIEINLTYHAFQAPETFARWASETPEDFRFAVKAFRGCTNRRVLAEAGEWVERFLGQGLERLGERLGPVLWQFAPTKAFAPDDFAAFLDLLPARLGALSLRHCVEVRHASFDDPRFVDACRARNIAVCLADSPKFPLIEADTADFVYARLMRGDDAVETGYPPGQIAHWADRLLSLAPGSGAEARDVFAFFIQGGKSRAPAAALALADRLAGGLPAPAVRSSTPP